ncbi:diphosphomevalonate decarboxylase, partial [Lactobacillus jensenii]
YYTIDAGPNVKILCQKNSCSDIKKYVKNILPNVKIVEAGFGPGITYLY